MPPQRSSETWADEIAAAIGEVADPARAVQEKRYLTVREAVKRLPAEQREIVLERYGQTRPTVTRRTRTPS